MLSGEGNAGEQWKTTIHVSLISDFFVHFFAVVFHDYNVKLSESS